MWNHLKKNHPPIFQKLSTSKKNCAKPEQPKLNSFSQYPQGSKENISLNRAVVDFVAGGLHSFNIVNEPNFIKMLGKLNKRYKVPSSQTIRTTAFDKRFDEIKDSLQNELNRLPEKHTINLTTDGWSSNDKQKSKYNSLTATYFDPIEKIHQTHVLAITPSTVSNTSEFILSEIVKALEGFDLQAKKFVYNLTTDTAAPMVKLAKITKGPNHTGWFKINRWLGCVGHRLHLVVTEALKVSGIRISTTKARDFTTKYTRNGQMRKQILWVTKPIKTYKSSLGDQTYKEYIFNINKLITNLYSRVVNSS